MATRKSVPLFLSLATSVVLGLSVSGAARAESIEVIMNQAKIVKLARPADTIVIGNPNIADASVKDSSTLVLTGKGFGVTNLVILDADGVPIVDEQIRVTSADNNSVQIYRRAELETLSCAPTCYVAYKNEAEAASQQAAGQ
ncbi:MAG: pilus assembly protein N-terminal domain-containing protein [Phyllobacteriaceae bacterium]|nr:pilus assembly protein N-terminal domain-containing protein [Phyllobacteriaceae bacterium]